MHDIPSLFNQKTKKTHEKRSKTHVTYWNARYSIAFQPKDLENTWKTLQNPRNSLTCTIFHHFLVKRPRKTLGISSFAGTCNTFPRVRTRALNARAKQTNKQTNKRTNKRTNKKRNREKTENVASPFLRPSSLLNYRRTVNVDNCKFFEDEDFVFSTKAIP